MTLHPRIPKRIRNECLHCTDRALDGSDYCGPHDAHERAQRAARQRRKRQKLADAGLCRDGCGRKVGKRRRPDGSILPRRCPTCRRGHIKKLRDDRKKARVTSATPGVTSGTADRPGNWRPDYDPVTGAEWQRYRGKGKRGRLSREQQIDEDLRDLRHAIEYLQEAQRRIERLKDPAVLDLPPIQREAAWRTAGEPIGSAQRQIDELAEKYG